MPSYKITAPDGRQFKVTGDSPPTEGELMRIYGTMGSNKSTQPQTPEWAGKYPNLYGAAGAGYETVGKLLEPLMTVAGAATTLPTGGLAVPAGAGLGYAMGKNLKEAWGEALGVEQPKTLPQRVQELPSDIASGALQETVGQGAPKVISDVVRGVGKLGTAILGTTTGSGQAAVEGAVRGGQGFKDAMRGKISPEDVVANAHDALNSVREGMRNDYVSRLEQIKGKKSIIDMTPLKDKVFNWLSKYKVGFDAEKGTLDFSNSKLPKEAATKVEEAFNDILRWDSTPGNNTAVGLDTLKQRLGNYYSDSSAARAVIADLEKATHGLISKSVPEYSKMTGNYAKISSLMKDIEKGLMMKKGASADQTLRRLNSAMRENFEMRLDLVKALSEKSGQDIQGQVAGYAMSPALPRGLFGKVAAGSEAFFLHNLDPKFWPLLASSSPRAVGEFLNLYGSGLKVFKNINQATGLTSIVPRTAASQAMMNNGGSNVPAQ